MIHPWFRRRARQAPLAQPRAGRLPDEPPESIVIVSPHFDDAVLSCWSVLTGTEEAVVLTVFTVGPEDDRVSDWDADTGLTSAERMVERAAENDAALAVAGRVATNLGLLQAGYGGGLVPAGLLRAWLAKAGSVYAPAGAGLSTSHPEHIVVRDACLEVRPDARLYADNPYAGFSPEIELPPGLDGSYRRDVVLLTAQERMRKAEAIRCYAGELAKLERFHGPLGDPEVLIAEVFWIPEP